MLENLEALALASTRPWRGSSRSRNLEALALASTRWICANCGLDVASVLDLEHIRAEKSRGPGIALHEVPRRVFSVEQSQIPEIS